MLLTPDKNKITTMIISKMKKSGEGKDSSMEMGEEEMMPDPKKELAKSIIKAMEMKSPEKLAMLLSDFVGMCDDKDESMEEDEGYGKPESEMED
jgi:hypothetical protein